MTAEQQVNSTTSAERNETSQGAFIDYDVIFQLTIAGVFLIAWEVAARYFGTQFYTSSPTEVIVALKKWAQSGQLIVDLQYTLVAAGLGFIGGSTVGGVVGFVLGWVKRLGDLLEPFVLGFYSLPKIALAPLFVLWFGIGLFNKVMFSGLLVFFMVFITTYQGTRQVDRDLVENARLMGGKRRDIWFKIAIPYSSVWVLTGVRVGLPYALIGAIVGEFVAASAGVGFRIKEATNFFDTAGVFAGLLVLMAISLVLISGLKVIERRALRWQNVKGGIQIDEHSV